MVYQRVDQEVTGDDLYLMFQVCVTFLFFFEEIFLKIKPPLYLHFILFQRLCVLPLALAFWLLTVLTRLLYKKHALLSRDSVTNI